MTILNVLISWLLPVIILRLIVISKYCKKIFCFVFRKNVVYIVLKKGILTKRVQKLFASNAIFQVTGQRIVQTEGKTPDIPVNDAGSLAIQNR